MSERQVASVLGLPVGTTTGWDQFDDWAIVLYDVDPYEGFDMPRGDLVVDYERGLLTQLDDAGNVTKQSSMLLILNGLVARNHHNVKKAAMVNATDA